ncbi:HET domain protein [Xylaria acuta]|nr:HET domain protein [Xylaria acuta]
MTRRFGAYSSNTWACSYCLMDHIALPSDNVAHPALEVPYLETQHFRYDDSGMLLYPQRWGIDAEFLALDQEPRLNLHQAAQFIQAWLWFGMLGECLRVGFRDTQAPRRINFDVFIKQTSHGKFVSLTRLREILASEDASLSPLFYEWRNTRLTSCLQIANRFVRRAMATLYPSGPVPDEEGHFSPIFLVLLSVQILGQTLLHSITGLKRPMPDGHVATDNSCTQLVDLLLIRSGWCRRDIEHLPTNIVFRYYMAYFQQPSCLHQGNRRGNDEEICSNHFIRQDAHFTPKHTHQQCFCPLISIPASDVIRIVSAQCMGLYTYREHDSDSRYLHQVAEPYNTDLNTPYVAVSHVRSVGLGNDEGNSLPHCQLSLLQALANQIVQPKGESSNIAFWVDALGLPVDRQTRKVAIRSLPLIFSQASAVLILDPTLYEHAFTHAEEAILRIRYSLWKSRLWTLQEGFHARKLVFRFSNALVSLEELLSRVRPTLVFAAGRINNSPSRLDLIRNEDLERALTRFVTDIHLAIRFGLEVDKEYLYSMLRAGYLLSKKFSLFIERNEWDFQHEVVPAIFDVYNLQGDLDIKIDSVSRRLRKILNNAQKI